MTMKTSKVNPILFAEYEIAQPTVRAARYLGQDRMDLFAYLEALPGERTRTIDWWLLHSMRRDSTVYLVDDGLSLHLMTSTSFSRLFQPNATHTPKFPLNKPKGDTRDLWVVMSKNFQSKEILHRGLVDLTWTGVHVHYDAQDTEVGALLKQFKADQAGGDCDIVIKPHSLEMSPKRPYELRATTRNLMFIRDAQDYGTMDMLIAYGFHDDHLVRHFVRNADKRGVPVILFVGTALNPAYQLYSKKFEKSYAEAVNRQKEAKKNDTQLPPLDVSIDSDRVEDHPHSGGR